MTNIEQIPYSERLRLYEAAKKELTGLTAKEYEDAVKALADYYQLSAGGMR